MIRGLGMQQLRLDKEFDRIWSKLEYGENFSLVRFADGERAILTGEKIKGVDGWVSTDYTSKLGLDLAETLNIADKKFIYGISCPCCDREAFYWYISRLPKAANVTFSNIFVNKNYKKFISKFRKLKRDAVFIGNYRAKDKKMGQLNILDYFLVDDDCLKFWEEKGQKLINEIKLKYGKKENLLFVVSAGPLSEVIIYDLFKNNCNNTYIDFGSSIDTFIHEKTTRAYQREKSKDAKTNCFMPNPQTTDFSVSAVLTLYKRPEKLAEQIEALEQQTLKPSEIIVFHDAAATKITLAKELNAKISNYIKADKNVGVWGRFAGGLLTHSKYVCFFDDDTIPGSRWLENCHFHMLKKKGIYGTIGIRSFNLREYPYGNMQRIGWDVPCNKTQEVDFLGHSWFLEKDWLGAMWINNSSVYDLKFVGEDAFLSYSLKKWLKLKSFVPPHPFDDIELYGSIPDKALQYGHEKIALSMDKEILKKMNTALNLLADMGMKPAMSKKTLLMKKMRNFLSKMLRKIGNIIF